MSRNIFNGKKHGRSQFSWKILSQNILSKMLENNIKCHERLTLGQIF